MFEVRHGNALDVMADLEPCSVDAIVTDPPYGLEFMGKEWDHGVPGEPFWSAALCVAKPGAHLVAFGGTRTHHRLACAIEDVGWEIRDCLMWLYGQGFPKSHNLSGGWGTALKPAWEPIILARKPLVGTVAENVQEHGTGALNVNGCRIEGLKPKMEPSGYSRAGKPEWRTGGATGTGEQTNVGRWPANLVLECTCRAPRLVCLESPYAGDVEENVRYARAAMADSLKRGEMPIASHLLYTQPGILRDEEPEERARGIAAGLAWGEHADATVVYMDRGKSSGMEAGIERARKAGRPVLLRWLDGREETAEHAMGCAQRMLDEQGGERISGELRGYTIPGASSGGHLSGKAPRLIERSTASRGGASRFFYTAKASAGERHYAGENTHPTVKPVDLMRWLVRLVTPRGGLVLDPFAGSGSTGVAALAEGMRFLGCDLDAESVAIARRRIAGPLFSGVTDAVEQGAFGAEGAVRGATQGTDGADRRAGRDVSAARARA